MPTQSQGLAEVFKALIVAFGGPTPTSDGLGELYTDLIAAVHSGGGGAQGPQGFQGNPVTQSTTSALIASQQAAQPSHQVTNYSTSNNHLWQAADTTFFTNYITTTIDPLAPAMF